MIKEVSWSDDKDAFLRISAGDDLELIKNQVNSRRAQLWECSKAGSVEAYVVTRLDGATRDSLEFVIVLGEGKGFFDYMPCFVEYAKKHKLPIRTHVKRKGLIRMWSRLGLELDEYVLRG